jgi:MoaA/NifB/PqqE/SkfB family radical SAM enzyme
MRGLFGKVLKYARRPELWPFKMRNLANRLDLAQRFGRGYALLPEAVHLCPTYRCNLDCLTCDVAACAFRNPFLPEEERAAMFRELDWPEMKKVVDHYAGLRPVVSLCGGEPFMYPHIERFLEYNLRDRGIHVTVSTNGHFLRRDARFLVKVGLPEVYVSVDGVREVYDKNRGRGTWNALENGLNTLLTAREEAGAWRPEIVPVFTINPFNQGSLVETWEYLRGLGMNRMIIHHLARVPPGTVEQHNREIPDPLLRGIWTWGGKLQASAPDLDLIFQQIAELRRRTAEIPGAELHCVPELPRDLLHDFYFAEGFRGDEKNPCSIFWKACYVMPSGKVHAHHLCAYTPLGDLIRTPLRQIWNSPSYRKIRQYQTSRQPMPLCRRCFGFYGAYSL